MKKRILSAILIILITFLSIQSVWAENEEKTSPEKEESGLYANSPYVLLADLNTGIVIYEKKSSERVYPADLTKIMTAVLTLENCKLEEVAVASETALSNVKSGSSKLGIIKEEKLSVRQLLYAMLLGSAADASNVLAEKISGSIDKFVTLMNEKAKELGMKNTNFTNPSGDHDERHYTTAQDMKKLVVYAMQKTEFCDIVKCDSYSIPATEKSNVSRKVTNRNHFVSKLLRNDYYYKYSTGIKTGYTPEAKSCIAASAEKNGISLLALVFGAETVDNKAQSFTDCATMFDFVFSNYSKQKIADLGEFVAQTKIVNTRRNSKLILKTDKPVSVLKPKDAEKLNITYKDYIPDEVSAPVTKNQLVGTREYFLGKEKIAVVNLVSDKDYALDPISFIVNKMIAFVTSPWLFVVILIVVIGFVAAERRRRKILRQKRREERLKRTMEMEERIKTSI